MNYRWKNILYTFGLLTVLYLVFQYRQKNNIEGIAITGKTMGTTYTVKYFDGNKTNWKPQIDSLLKDFNQSLSTYIEDSEISKFNKNGQYSFASPYFLPVLQACEQIHSTTNGYFDPTVMPLVNAWGFGPEKIDRPDSSRIDSIKNYIGFDKVVRFNEKEIHKTNPNASIDFSALAKGYGVDIISEYLKTKGLDNTYVEIGGEVRTNGKNILSDRDWTVGILNPKSNYEQQEFIAKVTLHNQAIATSGNYFNYRVVDGVQYSHTLDPKTGYPTEHHILSASVLAKDCMTADAYATAFMSMGHEKALKLIQNTTDIEVYLIFSTEDGQMSTFQTEGFKLTDGE